MPVVPAVRVSPTWAGPVMVGRPVAGLLGVDAPPFASARMRSIFTVTESPFAQPRAVSVTPDQARRVNEPSPGWSI